MNLDISLHHHPTLPDHVDSDEKTQFPYYKVVAKSSWKKILLWRLCDLFLFVKIYEQKKKVKFNTSQKMAAAKGTLTKESA